MSYRVDFTSAAARQMRKLPRATRHRLVEAVTALERDPRPPGALKLAGERTAWRIRVGDYRVIYDVYDRELTVTVVRAAHRREAYGR